MNRMGSAPRADRASDVFPTLDADLSDDFPERSGTTRRICIATPDILGPVKNGGIGTAYHHLARSLAEWGHEVVIAYVNGNAANAQLMEKTHLFYAGFDVAFEPIVPRPADKTMLAQVPAPTWALYDWLRTCARPFDIVHVSEWRGLGYGPLLAKSLGIAFGSTHFVVKGSSPTLWEVEGSRQLLSTEHELGWVFMEQRSVELADTVICGSKHLLGWMRKAGYAMPARSFVWPNVFPAPNPSPAASVERSAREGAALSEVVFFGRLEPRKGLVVFIDAIDRLVRRGRAPARITFLGKASNRIDGPGLIRNAVRDWPIETRTISDFGAEEAVSYLSRPGRLAVIPSLLENSSIAIMECLQAGIPFVAAATGGTPELVAPEDRARALVAPDHIALGERIAQLASAPLRAVRPRWDFEHALEVWSRWHAQSAPFETAAERFAQKARIARAETPLVTVCIVHHERPELVRMAVDSVLAQDYPALETVLVDDGSESTEALAALDALESEFSERGWRVLRQENRYLGAARNAAAAAARGEWLLFLDDDNVLFPDAVSRLVRAARFSGADCVPAASIRFFGDGDPRTDSESHGNPIRFLGAARAWNRFRNVVGNACALVRHDAFEAVGGFDEERGFAISDLSFFNHLVVAGRRVEPMPDPAYYYRTHPTSMMSVMNNSRLAETNRARVLASYVQGLPSWERAYAAYASAHIRNATSPTMSHPHPKPHAMAFERRRSRFGVDKLQVSLLLDPGWVANARKRHGREAACELRRNGRVVARARLGDVADNVLQVARELRIPAIGDALCSIHDAFSAETLAALITPASRRAQRVVGGVESRKRPEVRGWVLDPGNPGRSRWVAIHVDGRLRVVINAKTQRIDIARWKGTEGYHGFLWRIPEGLARKDGALIDVFDAETGRLLRGSPIRIKGGQVVASKWQRT